MTPAELAERRRALGLTQADLATLAGVPYHTYQKWELNLRHPPAYVWRDLEHRISELERERKER